MELIEDVGIGPAQWLNWLLADAGMLFCVSMQASFVGSSTTSIASDLSLGPNETALLEAGMALGAVIGTAVGGGIADSSGRRLPLLFSYAGIVCFGWMCAAVPGIWFLILARVLLGISMGLGAPAARVIVSETAPQVWRMPLAAMAVGCGVLGSLGLHIMVAFDDPYMQHLQWRWLSIATTATPLILLMLAVFFLYESPVFLASVGSRAAAEDGFLRMARWNHRAFVDVEYDDVSLGEEPTNLTGVQRFAGLFEPRLRMITVTFAFIAFIAGMVGVIGEFAVPQINVATSQLKPAYQGLMNGTYGIVNLALAGLLASALSRRKALMLAAILAILVLTTFAYSGMQPVPRSAVVNAAFVLANLSFGFVSHLSNIVLAQIGAEAYPRTLSTTGDALIQNTVQVAGFLGPFAFQDLWDALGRWDALFYSVAGLNVVVIFILALSPDPEALTWKGLAAELETIPARAAQATYGSIYEDSSSSNL